MTATELTDQDRAAAREAYEAVAEWDEKPRPHFMEAVYLAGKIAGQDLQREADARICGKIEEHHRIKGSKWWAEAAFECAEAIRKQQTRRS